MAFAHTIRNRGAQAAAAALVGFALAGAAVSPAPALAAGATITENGSATSSVYLSTDASKIIASVPTQVNFKVNGDGTLIAPSDDALAIVNKSVFGIRVDSLKTEATNTFVFVADASKATQENAVQLGIKPNGGEAVQASHATTGTKLTDAAWSLDRSNGTNSSVGVTMSGAVGNITKDLSTAQQFATISWTFAPGKLS